MRLVQSRQQPDRHYWRLPCSIAVPKLPDESARRWAGRIRPHAETRQRNRGKYIAFCIQHLERGGNVADGMREHSNIHSAGAARRIGRPSRAASAADNDEIRSCGACFHNLEAGRSLARCETKIDSLIGTLHKRAEPRLKFDKETATTSLYTAPLGEVQPPFSPCVVGTYIIP